MLAHEAHGVAVIHHHQGAVFLRQVADALEVGDKAVHGKDAVCGDQLDTAILGLLQLGLQVLHAVVLVAETLGFAQADPIDDAGMIELIGDHRVFRGKKGLKQASVGVKAGRVKDGAKLPGGVVQPSLPFGES